MKRKGIWITTPVILLILFLGGAIILYNVGKPVNVETNTELNGVDEDIRNALYYASYAPNSHNAQGWKVEINPGSQSLTIAIDKERSLNVVDPKYREAYISLGCYLEALTYAFDAYGYDTSVKYTDTADSFNKIINVSYNKRSDSGIDTFKLETIKQRHTNKSNYNTDELDATAVDNLLRNNNQIHYYKKGCDEFAYLQDETINAVTTQVSQTDYRVELNNWMRFSDEEVLEKKDGISAEMMGMNNITKAFYYFFTDHDSALTDKFAKQGINTAKRQVKNCSAFFVITGGDSVIDWIETGRKTYEFWYNCTQSNISIQPMSAIIEVEASNKDIQGKVNLDQPIQMILRAGYVKDYGENESAHRDLSDYITVVQ